jgi:hypothetical protein
MEEILTALRTLRAPFAREEYSIHTMVLEVLAAHGFHPLHEVVLGPRQRIDFMCGAIGIEIKRGKPQPSKLLPQISGYLASDALSALVLVTQRHVDLPHMMLGKPVRVLSLNALWGISL